MSTRSLARLLFWLLLATLLLLQLWMLLRLLDQGFRALAALFPLDYGEGPLLEHALLLARGLPLEERSLYELPSAQPPYRVVNYPPLFIALQAPFLVGLGPTFAVGRALSLLGGLAAVFFLALTIASLTRRRLAGLVGACMLPVFPPFYYWSPLNRVDMLALGLSWAGLAWIVLKRGSRAALWGGGALLVLAVFTRQSYLLAAPLAALVYVYTQLSPGAGRHASARWRAPCALTLWMGGLLLAGFLALQALTSGAFFFHIVTANANPLQFSRLSRAALDALRAYPLLLAGGVVVWVVGLRRAVRVLRADRNLPAGSLPSPGSERGDWLTPALALACPYLLGGLLSALTIAKDGSNVNYLLEFAAGLYLCAGICFARVLEAARENRLPNRLSAMHPPAMYPALFLLLACLQAAMLLAWGERDLYGRNVNRLTQAGEIDYLAQRIRAVPGPVLADDMMGLLPLNGKSIQIQPFELRMLQEAGLWDDSPLVQAVKGRQFDLVLMYEPTSWNAPRQRWTKDVLSAIYQNYTRSGSAAGMGIYIPDR